MSASALKIGVNHAVVLPKNHPSLKFERPDWALFRSVDTLSQKAGVPKHKLRRLVIKELVDNALDTGSKVELSEPRPGAYMIRDFGAGLDGTDEDIGRLFSINRPLVSSKLLRMPQRGALGNGLRVVAGAVAASGGSLRVTTRGRRLVLTPQDDGTTAVTAESVATVTGTMIEIEMGSEIPADHGALWWGLDAINFATVGGEGSISRTSPFWYDGDAFFELLQAAGDRPVRDLVASLDGCSGAKAGIVAAPFRGKPCSSLGRADAIDLLLTAREHSRRVRPERLGAVGRRISFPGYGQSKGSIDVGGRSPKATIPFVIEAWAERSHHNRGNIKALINRTPVTGELRIYFDKEFSLFGCGLSHGRKMPKGAFNIQINITTPHCPITSDGKSPDLSPFVDEIFDTVERAINGARRAVPPSEAAERVTQKSVVLANLDAAIDKASGNRQFRFNPRQVFYVLRPIVQDAIGAELTEGNFQSILTDYEAEHGDVPLMYRDPRGSLYHPHTGETIPLGTIAVEEYERPEWTFNKILYIEKEGWFETLRAMRWPERNDCALVTSKGNSTRAARDLLDLLGDHPEPITVFCVHDADGAGGMIYQTLQDETRARPRRRVEIINLGLEPWEAIEMGLDVETVRREKETPVAAYIKARPDGDRWCRWLQGNRVELNALTTPALVEWLDRKIREHDVGKVIPPIDVVEARLTAQVEVALRESITAKILRDADIDRQVADEMSVAELPDVAPGQITEWLRLRPDRLWKDWVAEQVVALVPNDDGDE